jgi:putative pyruvate formate lyase activating enzyme
MVSHAGLHFGEEPPISGRRGSGTVFFSGCNLQCVFCQNYQISQEPQNPRNRFWSGRRLVDEMLALQAAGAHNINFVSPSHVVFQMAEAIREARRQGLTLPVVYNSNGYDAVETLRLIEGLVDIYLPDCKYADNELGRRYSGVDDYADIIDGVLQEMLRQVGHLRTDPDGVTRSGLLVRHLVLPGHLENSRRCLERLAHLSPDLHISLMSQYSPQHQAHRYPAINRTVTPGEYDDLIDHALRLGLENVFIQDLDSSDHYLPDFDRQEPFA